MKGRSSYTGSRPAGITVLELLVGMAIFSLMLVLLSVALEASMKLFGESQSRNERAQSARNVLSLFGREIATAVVDKRTQFVVMPGSVLAERFSVETVVEAAPAALWLTPVSGEASRLHCVGYFLGAEREKGLFRLNRIFVPPVLEKNDSVPNPAFPGGSISSPGSYDLLPSAKNADWFLDNWTTEQISDWSPDNRDSIVSTVADGVVAMWMQCYDQLGNPIPWVSESQVHPESDLIYNSAGYFYAATTGSRFEADSFRYATEHPLAMKANRLPAEVKIVIITVDSTELGRGRTVPEMVNLKTGDSSGLLDLDKSVSSFETAMKESGFLRSETFSLRVSLRNAR